MDYQQARNKRWPDHAIRYRADRAGFRYFATELFEPNPLSQILGLELFCEELLERDQSIGHFEHQNIDLTGYAAGL